MSELRPSPLLTVWSLLVFAIGELRTYRRSRRHVCLYTDASLPPSCVISGLSWNHCNGRTATWRN